MGSDNAASSNAAIDVTGIGSAIVDVLAREEDDFIDRHGMVKGTMALIDADQAASLYGDLGPAREVSGGSAANTIAGIAALGGAPAFIGKVADDQLGQIFTHDIRAQGAVFTTSKLPQTPGIATARCLIVVTPDAQRTMNTYLGAAACLSPADIDTDLIARSQILYVEGYQWDAPAAKEAIITAAATARENGTKMAFTLSDPFVADRHRVELKELLAGHVDILFANEHEVMALYETEDFTTALNAARADCPIAIVTRGAAGSVICDGVQTYEIAVHPPEDLVDTTGAGDMYAAGVLWGMTHGRDLPTSGAIGALAASEVISHIGPRPEADLKALLAVSGL